MRPLRYPDAVNALLLVAPTKVLHALDSFLERTSFRNRHKDIDRHDALLGDVIRAMREDLQPGREGDDNGLHFRLLGVPPADWTPLKSAGELKAGGPTPGTDGSARPG